MINLFFKKSVDPNTTPSMKRALAETAAEMAGLNKASTPNLSYTQQQQQQQQQQRYVPSRQIINQPPPRQQPTAQQQQLEDEFDANGNLIEPLPISPRQFNQVTIFF